MSADHPTDSTTATSTTTPADATDTADTARAKSVRLAALDPAALGRDAASRVLHHMTTLAFQLQPGVTTDTYAPRATGETGAGGLPRRAAPEDADLDATQIAQTVSALTRYAQRGWSDGPVWDWTDAADVLDAIHGAATVLVSDPLGTDAALRDVLLGYADAATDPLRLMMTAAYARVCLAQGQSIGVEQLGALAGLSSARLRAMRSEAYERMGMRLRVSEDAAILTTWPQKDGSTAKAPQWVSECPPRLARRFLAAREVPGFWSAETVRAAFRRVWAMWGSRREVRVVEMAEGLESAGESQHAVAVHIAEASEWPEWAVYRNPVRLVAELAALPSGAADTERKKFLVRTDAWEVLVRDGVVTGE